MSDVARLANVSMQTVSRVINNKDQVSDETRAVVVKAIRELGYRPNASAQALASRKSKVIGLISTGVAAHSVSKRLLAFNEAARTSGYEVTIVSIEDGHRDELASAFEVLGHQNVAGVILIAADRDILEALLSIELDVPLVAAESSGWPGLTTVSVDQYLGARMATRHLIELGHREIRHLTGPAHSLDAQQRMRGWQAEMDEAGLKTSAPVAGDWRPDSGYLAGLQLAEHRDFTAVFAANDQMAIGLLHAFSEKGIRVPQDVSIVGFDDIPESAHLLPPLTTVRQDFDELGRHIMAKLIAAIEGNEVAQPALTEPTLVVRQSSRFLSPSLSNRSAG
ncbi:MAG: LacI family DNA-binding transcriptional regulator [Microbacteriaceae bacterium]|jgi:DNA-binding LacI/PurR family transcriptional regulator|nr:LacI family DNA-binding transcriptional regulator [Microbacteriaceae bacterium]